MLGRRHLYIALLNLLKPWEGREVIFRLYWLRLLLTLLNREAETFTVGINTQFIGQKDGHVLGCVIHIHPN